MSTLDFLKAKGLFEAYAGFTDEMLQKADALLSGLPEGAEHIIANKGVRVLIAPDKVTALLPVEYEYKASDHPSGKPFSEVTACYYRDYNPHDGKKNAYIILSGKKWLNEPMAVATTSVTEEFFHVVDADDVTGIVGKFSSTKAFQEAREKDKSNFSRLEFTNPQTKDYWQKVLEEEPDFELFGMVGQTLCLPLQERLEPFYRVILPNLLPVVEGALEIERNAALGKQGRPDSSAIKTTTIHTTPGVVIPQAGRT